MGKEYVLYVSLKQGLEEVALRCVITDCNFDVFFQGTEEVRQYQAGTYFDGMPFHLFVKFIHLCISAEVLVDVRSVDSEYVFVA